MNLNFHFDGSQLCELGSRKNSLQLLGEKRIAPLARARTQMRRTMVRNGIKWKGPSLSAVAKTAKSAQHGLTGTVETAEPGRRFAGVMASDAGLPGA